MFDPSFDPFEELEALKNEMLVLKSNQYQLASAYNQQNEQILQTVQQLQQISHIQTRLIQDYGLLKRRVDAWIQLSQKQNDN
jgi:hypothetical protein